MIKNKNHEAGGIFQTPDFIGFFAIFP